MSILRLAAPSAASIVSVSLSQAAFHLRGLAFITPTRKTLLPAVPLPLVLTATLNLLTYQAATIVPIRQAR